MKWHKIDPDTGEPAKRTGCSYYPNDYIAEDYRIINKSFGLRKKGWILTKSGNIIGAFDTLKEAKTAAEKKGGE